MMRAMCTPQEIVITIPMAGGYLTVVKAAMRPDAFVTDIDEACIQIQDRVRKVRAATPTDKDTARQELMHSVPLCEQCGAYSAYCSYCGIRIATPEGSCQCANTGSQSQLHVSDSNTHVSTELGPAIAACIFHLLL